jgi:hypothetical protein
MMKLLVLICVLWCAAALTESATGHSVDESYEGCPLSQRGHIDAIGSTWASMAVYRCTPSATVANEVVLVLKAVAFWWGTANSEIQLGISDILDRKKQDDTYFISREQKPLISGMLTQITDRVYNENKIVLVWKNGVTNLYWLDALKATNSQITKDTAENFIAAIGGNFVPTS